MKTDLFVVSHRKLDINKYPERKVIYVGKNINKLESDNINYFKDDSGDNIEAKNYTYCECSAIYWLYKNYTCDIIGIEHYRRLFCTISKKPRDIKYFEEKLKKYDAVVMINWFYFVRNDFWFKKNHGKEAYQKMRESIERLYPEYLKDFDKRMHKWRLSACNMIVTKKETYDKYCKFLFDVLFDIEKNIEIPTDPYKSRLMGFIAERLEDVYFDHNKLKRKKCLVLKTKRYE